MTLGNKIKEIREKANLKQEYVAEKLDLTQSTYSKIERDEIDITYSKLVKLSEIFNISLSKIIDIGGDFKIENNKLLNSPIGNNNTNNYSVASNIEELYIGQIQLLKEKIRLLEDKLNSK